MDKLLEIKIGGGNVHSGWVPLSALGMVRDLLDAIAEEGADEDIWRTIDPQVEVIGKGSTLLAVHTNFARKLRPQVEVFRAKAKRLTLSRKGRSFVKNHIATPGADWTYVEVIEIPSKEGKRSSAPPPSGHLLRFDARYKERFLQKQSEPIQGLDEIYAVVLRAGGISPTVTLGFLSGDESRSYPVRGKDLAKRLAAHLYETVKLRVEVSWNSKTMEVEKLTVLDLLEWRDVHLAEVYREHQSRLPLVLTMESVEDLMAEREEGRAEDWSEANAAIVRA